MTKKLPKLTNHDTELGSGIDGAVSDLKELGDEMRSWYDNMSENLQGGDKGIAVEECADALEGIDEPNVPDELTALAFPYTQMKPSGKKGAPRWMRRDNAVTILECAKARLEEWIELRNIDLDPGDEDVEETQERIDAQARVDEAQELVDALDTIIDDANGVEFPGMYG